MVRDYAVIKSDNTGITSWNCLNRWDGQKEVGIVIYFLVYPVMQVVKSLQFIWINKYT